MKETFLLVCGCLQMRKTQPPKRMRQTHRVARIQISRRRMEYPWYVVR